jgi:hypothetical protein
MKVTVDVSASELSEIRMYTGEKKKGPAIRKMVLDALMLKRREKMVQRFVSGAAGTRLDGIEAARASDRRQSKQLANKWRK